MPDCPWHLPLPRLERCQARPDDCQAAVAGVRIDLSNGGFHRVQLEHHAAWSIPAWNNPSIWIYSQEGTDLAMFSWKLFAEVEHITVCMGKQNIEQETQKNTSPDLSLRPAPAELVAAPPNPKGLGVSPGHIWHQVMVTTGLAAARPNYQLSTHIQIAQ